MSEIYGLALQQCALQLGILPDAIMLEQLELQTATPQQMEWQAGTNSCAIPTAFFTPYFPEEEHNSRLLGLLEGLFAKMPARPQQQLVYLLLPEFSGPDNAQLNALLQQLMRRWPELLQSEQCRVFPYGSAASLMAFNAAQQQLTQPAQMQSKARQIWLIAVDTLCSAAAFEHYQAHAGSYVLSEGALAVCLGKAANGLQLQFSATDANAGQAEHNGDVAIASLFAQAAQHVQHSGMTLNQLYLPDCGNDNASAEWLAQCHKLQGAITLDTAYFLPSYHSGELGASGGLYRLLHLMQAHQKGRLTGLTLAYEQSARCYRSVAVFAPANLIKEQQGSV